MAMAETNGKDPKAITGKTVLLWLAGFFGVIFLTNGIFLYYAVGTFPGVAVESSYEAGQAYNQEIAAAKAQEQLNWNISSELTRQPDGSGKLLVLAKDAADAPLYGMSVEATLKHPAQVNADLSLILTADGRGRYVSEVEALPAGNWTLLLEVIENGERKFKSENRIFIKE
jgi:nitrogen fixation protein FixH